MKNDNSTIIEDLSAITCNSLKAVPEVGLQDEPDVARKLNDMFPPLEETDEYVT